MAMAGVEYTYGREPPTQYDEPFAGVRRQPEPRCTATSTLFQTNSHAVSSSLIPRTHRGM